MFQKMYKDEPDNWQEVTEEEVIYRLTDWYHDPDLSIDAMKQGIQQDTPYAIFRWIPEA